MFESLSERLRTLLLKWLNKLAYLLKFLIISLLVTHILRKWLDFWENFISE